LSAGCVAGSEALQPFPLGVEGPLEGLAELEVVHRDHSQPGLQLPNLHLGVGQFKIDCLHLLFTLA
jgi:hypothetical protein